MTDEEHYDERIRQLERDHSSALARVINLERQQDAMWCELRRIAKEGRDEYTTLRAEQLQSKNELMAAITANKIAWSTMNSGTKVVAWLILATASVAGAITGFIALLRKFL